MEQKRIKKILIWLLLPITVFTIFLYMDCMSPAKRYYAPIEHKVDSENGSTVSKSHAF